MDNEKWNKYQNEYNKNHYKSISALLDKSLVNKFKAKLKEDNKSIAGFLKEAIEKYLGSNI